MLHFRSKALPETAELFMSEITATRSKNTCALYRAAIHHFHRFLLQQKLNLSQLSTFQIEQFDEDLARHNLKFVTRRNSIRLVQGYLRWLETRGDLTDGYNKILFPNYKPEHTQAQLAQLPELALKFIEVLGAINKPNTVNGYKACLRGFYRLHWKTGKAPYKIDREDVESFMIDLKMRNIGANQRLGRLIQFRRYLDWLSDHNKLKTEADRLLNSCDFPQKEEKLPRPFPVAIDLELQKRLSQSNDIDHLGLLLMRRTGLRVGELRNLTIKCVEEDLNGHWFLKVPLGKLNNERIFPLDLDTVAVIEKIKRHHSLRPDSQNKITYLISAPSGKRRSQHHFGPVLQDVTRDLAIPGKVTVHRLRHSFATSLLSAGLSITTLKILMGHRDIRMTLNYAAVTQETVRNEYFAALSKVHSRYEVASYPLKTPDLREGMNRAIYDAQKFAKKIAKDRGDINSKQLNRLFYRLMTLRNEMSQLLKLENQE